MSAGKKRQLPHQSQSTAKSARRVRPRSQVRPKRSARTKPDRGSGFRRLLSARPSRRRIFHSRACRKAQLSLACSLHALVEGHQYRADIQWSALARAFGNEAIKRLRHCLHHFDLRFQLQFFFYRHAAHVGAAGPITGAQVEQGSYLREREAALLRFLDETHPAQGFVIVETIAALAFCSRTKQTRTLVVAQRVGCNMNKARDLANRERHLMKVLPNPALRNTSISTPLPLQQAANSPSMMTAGTLRIPSSL